MDYEKDKNEQENNQELFEANIEQDPFNPENSLEEIKETAFEKGELEVEKAEEELEKDLEVFSEVAEGEESLVSELVEIKAKANEKVDEEEKKFKENLENIDSKKEGLGAEKIEGKEKNEKLEKEKALKEVGHNFAKLKSLQKELSKTKDPEEIEALNEQIKTQEQELKNSESAFKEFLALEIGHDIKNNPEANNLSHIKDVLIPGLSALEMEKIKAVSAEKDPSFAQKALKFIGRYSPKSHLAKTITVAAIVAGTAIVIGGTHGLPLAYALGSKVARSVIGSVIGEKVGEFVGKKMEKSSEKKRVERLKEGLDGSLETMIKLAEKEIEIKAQQEKLRGRVKFATHLLTAGGIMSGLKLAEYGALELLKQSGLDLLKHGAEHGVKAGIEASAEHGVKAGIEASAEHGVHAAETASKDLSAYLLHKSSSALKYGITFAPIDYAGDQIINKASGLHNPGGHH